MKIWNKGVKPVPVFRCPKKFPDDAGISSYWGRVTTDGVMTAGYPQDDATGLDATGLCVFANGLDGIYHKDAQVRDLHTRKYAWLVLS